jgi:pyruvate dehydrogenase E1 component
MGASDHPTSDRSDTPDLDALREVQRRVLWLAVRMVDHANRERVAPPAPGGATPSSPSRSAATWRRARRWWDHDRLWFGHIGGADKVAVKPHASPVFHAIKYLHG